MEREKSKPTVNGGTDPLVEKYGGVFPGETEKQRKTRFEAIDWLEANLAQASSIFGAEEVERRLCALKGIYFR